MNRIATRRLPQLAATLGALMLLLAAPGASASDDAAPGHHYAARGQVMGALPRDAMSIRHQGNAYFYRGGDWYRPRGSQFVVIAPPLGAVVPFLPGGYATFWFGGIPYYFANDVYYMWRADADGYVVTQPPPGAPSSTAPVSASTDDEPYVYPKLGQSDAQQATDRYECHRWAVDKAGFDPTMTSGTTAAEVVASGRKEYLRALSACLDGRGYSVK